MAKSNPYFPIEVALHVALVCLVEAVVRIGPRLLGARADTYTCWLLGAGILALSALLPWESQKKLRRAMLYAGLFVFTLGSIYATSWWLWGLLITAPGYTLGAIVAYTLYFLAGKDMDNVGEPPGSPVGKAGPALVGFLGVACLALGGASLSAGSLSSLL